VSGLRQQRGAAEHVSCGLQCRQQTLCGCGWVRGWFCGVSAEGVHVLMPAP
jgi:hypothetical protein